MKLHYNIIIGLVSILSFASYGQSTQTVHEDSLDGFAFIFATDVHLTPDSHVIRAFHKAADSINSLNPDFIIMGGDMVFDVMKTPYSEARSLFKVYIKASERIEAPIYHVLGNHDVFGTNKRSGVLRVNPFYGKGMFRFRLGKTFSSFTHKGHLFILLNSINYKKTDGYFGKVNQRQIRKITRLLKNTDEDTPIILVSHIPFETKQSIARSRQDSIVRVINAKEITDLFSEHNLQAVLQGHVHYAEDISYKGVRYITGGAVSGRWWTGSYKDTKEGFMYITVKGNTIDTQYVEYEPDIDDPNN